MSRNKENVPLATHSRVNGARLTSKINQNEEFFTDSILSLDATRTSHIPTPSPQKAVKVKPRRALNSKSHAGVPYTKHKISASESHIARPASQTLQPSPSLRRSKSPDPPRLNTLATPPKSRDGLPLSSPHWDIRSPPPREFSDVYQQIADEEDLAATEGEFSDPDDFLDEDAVVLPQHLQQHPRSFGSRPGYTQSSRGSTPTQQVNGLKKANPAGENTGTASDPTGMSFVNNLTDEKLRATLTPHFSESARDRAKLTEVWQNQKPIAFTKVGKVRPAVTKPSTGSGESVPRITAFTKSSGYRTKALSNGDSHSDPVERPGSQSSIHSTEDRRVHNDIWHDEDRPLKPLPINARVERKFPPTWTHGFPPADRVALTKKNLEQQNKGGKNENVTNSAPSSIESHPAESVVLPWRSQDQHPSSRSNQVDHGQRAQSLSPNLLKTKQQKTQQDVDSSQVDWAAAAGSIPLPSIEDGSETSTKGSNLELAQKETSPERSRRWDNDFTGQSFQVSESPPVRNKAGAGDYTLDKEIKSLTKQALTTSRLGEIREKHSQEQLRRTSRSPPPRSASISSEKRRASFRQSIDTNPVGPGEPIPNTPIVIFRSSSNGSNGKRSSDQSKDRSTSHDYLQRLSRVMSTTPQSSPGLDSGSKEQEKRTVTPEIVKDDKSEEAEVSVDEPSPEKETLPIDNGVAKTPKITGAWTDTILPDTIKTTRRTGNELKHVQTPHVSAGGWFETPAPVEGKAISQEMSPIVEEVTEEVPAELTNGIVKDKASEAKDQNGDPKPPVEPSAEKYPNSGLASILDRARAKQRLISQDITTAGRDNDTLNLGNETIESLQGILDADDITALSKLSFIEDGDLTIENTPLSETQVLERLGVKLDRLRNNIHDARKGISKLEHQVSTPDQQFPLETMAKSVCQICKDPSNTSTPHVHDIQPSGIFPSASLMLSLPVPLLFHPKQPDSTSRLPRPTLLGWLTIALWTWYVAECTMCELYCRPMYAEYYEWPSRPEPEFPLVIPTMLYRWSRLEHISLLGSYLLGPIWRLVIAAWRILGMWTGRTDGFVDSSGTVDTVATATIEALRKVTSTVVENGPDLSMMNDELL